ncbi:hypothetical protein BTO20_37430 (plasmid) [Mycobacterium dioxanotrophicus]|jgi:single-strand DNA-binding protein|uniref:Single-stranded DNA-binding protein n=1 Tax=Mycobacterium dioxanotrophicus TaxID=482462 RepID=A0A1Y0CGD0_9MYCO|nr:single-stranded DNA-binding protein [Mycobacterium dioxanotrophicus]ART74310.1 hypothetical protein BTO20_37430 [Mycobacterium dioxanotrophicus]
MSTNSITISGNVTADPELRFTPGGKAVAHFTVADTPRYQDDSGAWRDGETLYQRVEVWGDMAENVAESLTKGAAVIVTGRVMAKSYKDRETGEKKPYTEIRADEIGASLRYATAKLTRVNRRDK